MNAHEAFERGVAEFEAQLDRFPWLKKKTREDLIAGFREGFRAGMAADFLLWKELDEPKHPHLLSKEEGAK